MTNTKKEETPKTNPETPNNYENKQLALKESQEKAIESLRNALNNLKKLADTRANNKMSNSRVNGVARELKELIKVMSVYM